MHDTFPLENGAGRSSCADRFYPIPSSLAHLNGPLLYPTHANVTYQPSAAAPSRGSGPLTTGASSGAAKANRAGRYVRARWGYASCPFDIAVTYSKSIQALSC
jgi:hypothetical protein